MRDPDKPITLAEAGMLSDPPAARTTVIRWTDVGKAGVVLRTKLVNGRIRTTRRWLEEFHDGVYAAKRSACEESTRRRRMRGRR